MKSLFDKVSYDCSKITTNSYSTSFSLGIKFLDSDIRDSVYGIYGFVRFADEIVDTFHDYDKRGLLDDFRIETQKALDNKISLNPILNSFQATVHKYNIDYDLIWEKELENKLDDFYKAMNWDKPNPNLAKASQFFSF